MPKALWNGAVIAESNSTQLLEGNVYFPFESVDKKYLSDSETTSICPWKGTANYHTIIADGAENKDAAWYYTDPKPAAAEIKDRIAFWKGVKVA